MLSGVPFWSNVYVLCDTRLVWALRICQKNDCAESITQGRVTKQIRSFKPVGANATELWQLFKKGVFGNIQSLCPTQPHNYQHFARILLNDFAQHINVFCQNSLKCLLPKMNRFSKYSIFGKSVWFFAPRNTVVGL